MIGSAVLKGQGFLSSKTKNSFDFLKIATRSLLFIAMISLFYMLFFLFVKQNDRPDFFIPTDLQNVGQLSSSDLFFPEAGAFDDYARVMESRDLFEAIYGREFTFGKKTTPVSDLDFEKNFRLVGILLDGDPRAIVEDLKNKQTLFLSEGQEVGDAVLESIEKGKVIFISGEKVIELVP